MVTEVRHQGGLDAGLEGLEVLVGLRLESRPTAPQRVPHRGIRGEPGGEVLRRGDGRLRGSIEELHALPITRGVPEGRRGFGRTP